MYSLRMETGENKPMFKITAVCNHEQSSLKGVRVSIWHGKTKAQAEKWLPRLEREHSRYSDWQIEVIS